VPQSYKGNTNEVKEVKLASAIQTVAWTCPVAAPGAEVSLEIFTSYVGNGAELEVKLSEHSGKKHGTLKGIVAGNRYRAAVTVPEKAQDALYADVKLSKHGLKQKSPPLLLVPPVQIKNLKWSAKEARRGDVLTLTADIEGAPVGTDAKIGIWEHDDDGAHDPITDLSAPIKSGKVKIDWEYEYHEDTDDIPTTEEAEKGYNPPEYFFRVEALGVTADSDLLKFKDWIEIELKDQFGAPIPEENYTLRLPDGSERKGKLDKEGKATEKDVPPGKATFEFPDL